MIIDGKALADEIQREIKREVDAFTGRSPALAVFLVGSDPASEVYVRRKIKACEEVGIRSFKHSYPENVSETELLDAIHTLNEDPTIDGILVQLPLPNHINTDKINHSLDPEKDVDGFHPLNMGRLLIGETEGFIPCTPLGILTLLEHIDIPLTGKHIAILGSSNIVGKPMAALLLQQSLGFYPTITIINKYTPNIPELCQQADVLIIAIGDPKFITEDMIKEGATVIDVGINKLHDNTIVGDVNFEEVKEKCRYITPVPGGVGPMTIAMLLKNTLKSYKKRLKLS